MGGLIIALVRPVLSPFEASGNPLVNFGYGKIIRIILTNIQTPRRIPHAPMILV